MPAPHADPIVAIASAPGRGAVGILRISGHQLAPLAHAWLGQAPQARHATYLPFPDATEQPIDHGLALYFPAPHSFTGEDVLELQAHGGPVVLQRLLARALEVAGTLGGQGEILPRLRMARPGEFSERAFLNGKMDLAQAEAVADLIDASTEAAARSAAASLSGAFSTEVNRLRDALVHLRMLVEATLDFPEEELDFLKQSDVHGQLARLRAQLALLQGQARQGALLRDGLNVVIAGQPNAGKSSLLNALAGAELAIVTPIAGTTRDTIGQTIQIEGVPLHMVDTAGLRDSEEPVESLGIARAWRAIGSADVVLFVHDLERRALPDYQQADRDIGEQLTQTLSARVPVLHVWNKCDAQPAMPAVLAPDASTVLISAKTGSGLDDLRHRLLLAVGWQADTGARFSARQRHVQALGRVDSHLAQADTQLAQAAQALDLLAEELRLAHNALGEITGAFTADDLLGVIFSSFCIGK